MFEKKCGNDTEPGCGVDDSLTVNEEEPDEWLEETVWYGLRMWHVIFLSIGIALSIVILLCCCFKFRIPRTKQEIEGDYVRRRIMRKFRKRLKAIQNQELDEMDLKKALDKIRTELKSDTESLQQSDVLSGGTISSAGLGAGQGSTYRRASQIQIDISLEDLRIQSMGLGARIAMALSRLFRRGRGPGQDTAMEEGNANNTLEGADKPTTALLSAQGDATQQLTEDESSKTKSKKKKDKSKPEPSSSSTPASKENTNTASKDKEKTKKSQPTTTGKETKSSKAKGKSTEGDKDKNKDTQVSKTDKSSTASGSTGKGKAAAAGGDTTSSKKSDKSKKQP